MSNKLNKTFFDNLGGTWVKLSVDGCDYVAVAYRAAGEVELRSLDGGMVSMNAHDLVIYFDDDMEQAHCEAVELPSQFYWEHAGKTEYDLAQDVGQWLASVEG